MYAREKIRPKLFDLDQEKLSRLFADLRRESLATGSYPITVRHLESMIRMAEASAKMALREYVRADDVDLAISVAVGSFVSTQKMSIKKTLERVRTLFLLCRDRPADCCRRQGFRKYLTQARDHEELLAFVLGQIIKDKVRLYQLQRHQQPEVVTAKVSELEERVSGMPSLYKLMTKPRHRGRRRNTISSMFPLSFAPSYLLPTVISSTMVSSPRLSEAVTKSNRPAKAANSLSLDHLWYTSVQNSASLLCYIVRLLSENRSRCNICARRQQTR